MINPRIALLGFLSVLLAMPVQAQIFMCKNASGRTISSDRPIPDCTGPIREFAKDGQIRRTIPPPLTATQKEQKKIEEAKLKVETEAAAEKKRQDRAILARYNNEFEIEAARKRTLSQLQEQTKRDTLLVTDAEKQLATANDEITVHKLKKTKPPLSLIRKLESSQSTIDDGKKSIKERDEQIAEINGKFDETLKRFRELTAPAPAAVTTK